MTNVCFIYDHQWRSRMQSFKFELDWVYTGVHIHNVWKSSNRAVLSFVKAKN